MTTRKGIVLAGGSGNPVYEYEYVDQYLKRSSFGLLMLDLWIIWKGVLLIVKGGGH